MNEFDLAWSLLKGLPEQQMGEGGYARVQRHNALPRRGNKNFQRQMNEASNYDIDEMMNRDSQELQGQEMARPARAKAARAAQEPWVGGGPEVRGSMTPEQYNIWRERMHGMAPQEAAPGKEFENRKPPKSLLSPTGAQARLRAGETLTSQQLMDAFSEKGEEPDWGAAQRRLLGEEPVNDYEQNPYENIDWPKRGAKVATGEPMDIAFQLLKDSAKARDGSPFAFPKRDDPNYNPYDQMSQDLSNYPKSRYGDYVQRQTALSDYTPKMDPITDGRMNPMSKVNPNVPEHFQPPPPPPNMDPSWTPEAIARINAQNDKARKELSGEGGGY